MKHVSDVVINEKVSIKNQLRISYSIMVLLSVALTLGICIGLLYSLAHSSYSTAKSKIDFQTDESVVAVSIEIANAIGQNLKTISETICMTSALYSSLLMQYANQSSIGSTLLVPQPSYRDYHLVGHCKPPLCMSDYGLLANTRSRLPSTFINGSVIHTSVYLYSGKYNLAVRNDSMWSRVTAESPMVTVVENALPYQDSDFRYFYRNGLNMSVLYYLSTKIVDHETEVTNTVHRTFPGIILNASIYGDPSQLSWFANAPTNAVFMDGPTRDPYTKQLVTTLSSRKTITNTVPGQASTVTFVAAAVVMISKIATEVSSVDYKNDGFGAVMKIDGGAVLVWANVSVPVYDDAANEFFTLTHFDAHLATLVDALTPAQKQLQQTFRYTGDYGVQLLCSYVPMLAVQAPGSNESSHALALLVFSHTSEAESPLLDLSRRITVTTTTLTGISVIIVVFTVLVVLVAVFFSIQYITKPLAPMMAISADIIQMSTADDSHKDYSAIVNNPLFRMNRQDELGLLISDYYQLLTVLQTRSIATRDNSVYPLNPFHLADEDVSAGKTSSRAALDGVDRSWRWFMDKMCAKLNEDQLAALAEATAVRSKRITAPKNSDQKPRNDPIGDEVMETSVSLAAVNKPLPGIMKSDASKRRGSRKVAMEGETPFETIQEEVQADLEGGTPASVHVMRIKTEAIKENKKEFSKSLPSSKGEANRVVTVYASLKTQLNSLFGTLLLGLVVTMVVMVSLLHAHGEVWISSTELNLRAKIVENMQSIVFAKSTYVQNYFEQLSLDLLTSSRYLGNLLNGNLTRPGWFAGENPQLYLPSYSLDWPANPYSVQFNGSHNFSGYFIASAVGCASAGTCSAAQDDFSTRLTSLLDIKFRSLFRTGTLLSYIQMGLESDGTMRYLPYNHLASLGAGKTCYVQDTTQLFCSEQFYNSSCDPNWVNPLGAGIKKYPIYDSRCRAWYTNSVKYSTRNSVYFQTPKVSDTGAYVLTGGVAVHKVSADATSPLRGVVNSNFLITTLSKSIAKLSYLTEGYCYLVQASNTSKLIIHPKASPSCGDVSCAEGFTPQEFVIFENTVLLPIQNHEFNVSTTYIKQGMQWQIVYGEVQFNSFNYVLFATLPVKVIEETSLAIKTNIDTTIVGMVIGFVLSIFFLVVFSVLYAVELVRSIVNPINDLRKVFELVRMNEDLSGQVSTVASSSDMRVLLDAFSKLMVALRFSTESYAAGNQKRTREVFTDALDLYTGNNDKRGIGISLTNLAASELARKRYDAAESLCKKAIENAEDILKDRMESAVEAAKMERMLSDRRGLLAVIYLEDSRLGAAMTVLLPALERDIKKNYLIGYATKQASLCRYYLNIQVDAAAAERLVHELTDFMKPFTAAKVSPAVASTRVLREEVESADQIALYEVALFKAAQKEDWKRVESAYIDSLVCHSVMHLETTSKALVALKKQFSASHRTKDVLQLEFLAAEFNINVARDTTSSQFGRNLASADLPPKRVMFCLDYSANMAGVKLQAVMDNVNTVFEQHLNDRDSLSILYFNQTPRLALPILPKKDNELLILDNMERVSNPKGTAALYDSIAVSLYALELELTPQDWLVVVTNCEDSASHLSLQVVLDKVMFSKVGLIIIGVGEDVKSAALEMLATSNKRGVYFHAEADKKSINEAFEHAVHIITAAVAATVITNTNTSVSYNSGSG